MVGQVTSRDTDDGPVTIRVLDAGDAVIGVPMSPDVVHTAVVRRRPRIKATVTSRLEPVLLAPPRVPADEHHFQGHRPVQPLVPGPEDDPHAAAPEDRLHLVAGDLRQRTIVPQLRG